MSEQILANINELEQDLDFGILGNCKQQIETSTNIQNIVQKHFLTENHYKNEMARHDKCILDGHKRTFVEYTLSWDSSRIKFVAWSNPLKTP